MNKGRKEYIYLWFIENYSCMYNIAKNGKALISPNFMIEELEGKACNLLLYPKGYSEKDIGRVSLFLRSETDAVPKDFSIKFELSVLAVGGSSLHSREYEFTFKEGIAMGSEQFHIEADEILRRKAEYLPKDTLSVCCKIWKGEGDVRKVVQISARNRITTEKVSFPHIVKSFSSLLPNVKRTFRIKSSSKEKRDISSSIYFTKDAFCEEKIMVEIALSDTSQILYKCEVSLLNGYGNVIECTGANCSYSGERINIIKMPLSLTRDVILSRKSEYLPDDKLVLLCECTLFKGSNFSAIEEIRHDLSLPFIKQKSNHAHNRNVYKASEQISGYPSVSEDMRAIYINQCLTDVELITKTKSFPAHKIVLCARSDVFKAILTSDMKEKNTDCIHVDDLENDTAQQLLLFLYSDSIETLQWNSATKLYYAADKYHIGKLKAMCSAFLTENLSASNASELLLLADTHSDPNLKRIVEDFILKHEEQVFGSNGWEKLIETSPLLVIKTMHLKYKRKNKDN
ncbi:TD and POZ domain-containing protein 4 [Araneus ventricosus]|uniref:TD and POZ domain-containing protein 4 n=1 Tax=Araneus ventricosus TaxID=182803 RepID=A0A4Y2CG65_ARAVE|nr:TD and POZ domain-containing protein 4 [Araneus ventricosus]